MKQAIVLIGIGEMGGEFARGFLRSAHPVYPVTRALPLAEVASQLPDPGLALVAVAEADLHPVLERIPEAWRGRVGLLQNELLPRDWERHNLQDPTVISVWFEKKKGQITKVLLPSPVFGPHARLLAEALRTLDIPTRILGSPAELLLELVLKNVYILTTNICGLVTGGTVGELWDIHEDLAQEVASEVLAIQAALTGAEFSRERMLERMVEAFRGDLAHKCRGRSAPARLQRTLEQAAAVQVNVTRIREISKGL